MLYTYMYMHKWIWWRKDNSFKLKILEGNGSNVKFVWWSQYLCNCTGLHKQPKHLEEVRSKRTWRAKRLLGSRLWQGRPCSLNEENSKLVEGKHHQILRKIGSNKTYLSSHWDVEMKNIHALELPNVTMEEVWDDGSGWTIKIHLIRTVHE